MTGLNGEIHSLGKIEILLSKPPDKFCFLFNLVEKDYNIPYDGIIGDDFLSEFQAEISYKDNTISFNYCFELLPNSVNQVPIHFITNNRNNTVLKPEQLPEGLQVPTNILMTDEMNTYPVINETSSIIKISPLNINTIQAQQCTFFSNYDGRERILNENLRVEHLNQEEREEIKNLCLSFQDIFFLPGDKLTATPTITHEIILTDPTPIAAKMYRYPKIHEKEVNDQVTQMLDQQIIQPSTSPWSSPLWVVPKKLDASGKQKWRIVTDYRRLNEVTVSDHFPLPNIEDVLDQLGEAIYFSTLDLASGFHQVPMKTEDKAKTAFSTPRGHFEFNRMTFGLKNAPATFQRLINTVLVNNLGHDCFVYLDDIIIFGKNLKQHNERLSRVFKSIRHHNLKLQPDKCEFLRKEVTYLGHVISENGVQPNPDKIKAVVERKEPKNTKDIKSFLGLTGYYRRFIPNYANIAKPLTRLLKKDTKFNFDDNCRKSFENLKNILTSQPLLQFPNFNEPFILTTDASNDAIGSILSQGVVGKDLPIAYYSRTLNSAERNYSTTEKELLSIVQSVKHFRPYLYGKEFTILTDHKPLQWLMNCKDPSSRLVRWRLKLLEYQYKILYKAGKINTNADALSRPVLNIINPLPKSFKIFQKFHQENLDNKEFQMINKPFDEIQNLIIPYSTNLSLNNPFSLFVTTNCNMQLTRNIKITEIVKLNTTNNNQSVYLLFTREKPSDQVKYETIYECLKSLADILVLNNVTELHLINIPTICKNIKQATFNSMLDYLIPDHIKITLVIGDLIHPKKEEIPGILKEYHDNVLSGHPGITRTYQELRKKYFWKGIKQDVEKYVKKCQVCQSITDPKLNKSPMLITTTADDFNDVVALDIMGPYHITPCGNRYILTIQDELTKFVQAYPIPTADGETCAIHLLKYCSIFGFPTGILTDQGTEFLNKLFKEVTRLLTIKHKNTSPYHPQTNGSLERSHSTLKNFLRSYIDNEPDTWDELIYLATHSHNTHINRSTNETPYTLVFGREARIPRTFEEKTIQKPTYQNLTLDIITRAQKVRAAAKENLIQSKTKSKEYYDKKTTVKLFQTGQLVLLQNTLRKVQYNRKLEKSWLGPFKIIQDHPDSKTATLQVGTKLKTYHYNLLKPYVSDAALDNPNDSDSEHSDLDDPGEGPSTL